MQPALIAPEVIEARVILLRGEKVLLDLHLAGLYGVTTTALNQAVRRNAERFPADFMFQLTADETLALRALHVDGMKKRALAKPPMAFTEQGVAMLSGLLNSPRAVAVNIEIMRAFVRLRQMIAGHADLARKLAAIEKKYDAQFKAVFDAIRELMTPPAPKRREIGFHATLRKQRPAKSSR
ncbi:MAG: ORF6N domain-containing protein [Opitutae bacterium]|nr:ORF6N domain-containing protein [Opitutae bacterium]